MTRVFGFIITLTTAEVLKELEWIFFYRYWSNKNKFNYGIFLYLWLQNKLQLNSNRNCLEFILLLMKILYEFRSFGRIIGDMSYTDSIQNTKTNLGFAILPFPDRFLLLFDSFRRNLSSKTQLNQLINPLPEIFSLKSRPNIHSFQHRIRYLYVRLKHYVS